MYIVVGLTVTQGGPDIDITLPNTVFSSQDLLLLVEALWPQTGHENKFVAESITHTNKKKKLAYRGLAERNLETS